MQLKNRCDTLQEGGAGKYVKISKHFARGE
jgi:hypothetical protein